MPLTSEEVLNQLVAATSEAKFATREAHEAHGMLRRAIKEQKAAIADAIAKEVEAQIGLLADEIRVQLKGMAEEAMQRLVADWRGRLGLDG